MLNQNLHEITQLLKLVDLRPLPATPLVSMLTPNYNYARYLGEAIESALAQTYTNFEMIVCDDGSTDNSCEIVERYAQHDARIKLIRKENGGVASALNAAYRESKGEIICLLDADDRFLPQKLEMVAQAFCSRPDSGFLGHQMFRTDAGGRRLGVSPWITRTPDGWYGPFVVRNGDCPPGLAFGSGLCLRREISNLIFPFPDRFRSGVDGVIMALAPLMTPLIGLPVPLAEYRCHPNNLTNTVSVTSESLDCDLRIGGMFWKLQKEYLDSVDPRLGEIFPAFDLAVGVICNNYTQARLQKTGQALPAYRNLVRSEKFFMLSARLRWFWRLSVFLPLPLFRYALNIAFRPNRLKQWLWWLLKYAPNEARRRLFAS